MASLSSLFLIMHFIDARATKGLVNTAAADELLLWRVEEMFQERWLPTEVYDAKTVPCQR